MRSSRTKQGNLHPVDFNTILSLGKSKNICERLEMTVLTVRSPIPRTAIYELCRQVLL